MFLVRRKKLAVMPVRHTCAKPQPTKAVWRPSLCYCLFGVVQMDRFIHQVALRMSSLQNDSRENKMQSRKFLENFHKDIFYPLEKELIEVQKCAILRK
jgi:hypothetical protein